MNIAIYPGSFDPITNGHLDIIKRASKIFDKLYILVSINPKKNYAFTIDERIDLVKTATIDLLNVEVISSFDLTVNVAKSYNCNILVRGIRNTKDFEDERELSYLNKNLNKDIETIYMIPELSHTLISSSAVKELIKFNGNIDEYVPQSIKEKVLKVLKNR